MKFIIILIKNIKNLLPYLLLIVIYFFFVNLEARKESNNYINTKKESLLTDDKLTVEDKNSRIPIPVIPYKQ